MPRKRVAPWGPCDDFLDPLVRLLDRFATEKPPDDETIGKVSTMPGDPPWFAAKVWFEFHTSLEYSDRLFSRVDDLAGEVLRWFSFAKLWHEQRDNPGARIMGCSVEMFAEQLRIQFGFLQSEAVEVAGHLRGVSAMMRSKLHFTTKPAASPFAPTEIERLILKSLYQRAMTADELGAEIGGSRQTLYGGKSNRGGINSLKAQGLVKLDRKIGGYYRPDAPPRGK